LYLSNMKKKIIYLFLVLFVGVSFVIPKHSFNYKILNVIKEEDVYGNSTDNIESILSDVLSQTTSDLTFKLKSNSNLVFETKIGNCIGYTKYYNKVLSDRFKKENLGNITISHARAKVLFAGQNIHFSNSPALKDHDITIVKNNKTGDVYYVDASLSEVFGNIIVKR
jgi:hypothetical protein